MLLMTATVPASAGASACCALAAIFDLACEWPRAWLLLRAPPHLWGRPPRSPWKYPSGILSPRLFSPNAARPRSAHRAHQTSHCEIGARGHAPCGRDRPRAGANLNADAHQARNLDRTRNATQVAATATARLSAPTCQTAPSCKSGTAAAAGANVLSFNSKTSPGAGSASPAVSRCSRRSPITFIHTTAT